MNRTKVTALALSAAAFVTIAVHEGFRGQAYIPIPGDKVSIGFGTTDGVKQGDTITVETALGRALTDAQKFEGALKQCVTVPLHQHEYDAYVSLSYNIGSGAFCRSTLVKKLNAGDYDGSCKEILRWNRAGGKEVRGLTIRRQQEYVLCMG